jgi:hypothetical protein
VITTLISSSRPSSGRSGRFRFRLRSRVWCWKVTYSEGSILEGTTPVVLLYHDLRKDGVKQKTPWNRMGRGGPGPRLCAAQGFAESLELKPAHQSQVTFLPNEPEAFVRDSKDQNPNSNQLPMPKLQSNPLGVGVWLLELGWSLGFGIWSLSVLARIYPARS